MSGAVRGVVIAALALGALAPAARADDPDGAQTYQRCAACHLPTGSGVPGAFPPLAAEVRALAQTPAGREYLMQVVIKGLVGPLTVEGKPYLGVMPAQDLDDAGVAAVLNHVVQRIAKADESTPPFTAAQVAAARAAAGEATGADIAKRHDAVAAR